MEFHHQRAKLWGRSVFRPFTVAGGEAITKLIDGGKIGRKQDLLVMDRLGKRLAFTTTQMAYHHVAQGEIDQNPYLITF